MMVAGTYYVGDLCYVIQDDNDWKEVCGLMFPTGHEHGRGIYGEFTLKDGRKIAIYGTKYGDGSYYDQKDREYMVDSGTIGCILKKDIKEDERNFENGGQILEFLTPFRTRENDGKIYIGHICIKTGD